MGKSQLMKTILNEMEVLDFPSQTEDSRRECAALPCMYLGKNDRECAALPCMYLGKEDYLPTN